MRTRTRSRCSTECISCCFFFQGEDGIRDLSVTGVQTCALPISCSRGPELVVVNNSREIVSNVVVKFTGGETGIGQMQPGESRRLRIKSRGESHAVITFARSEERRVGKERRDEVSADGEHRKVDA